VLVKWIEPVAEAGGETSSAAEASVPRRPKYLAASPQLEPAGSLIESPQSFDIIGIQFEQLSQKHLRNLGRGEIHPVQSTKQRQQIQTSCFQTGAQIRGNDDRGASKPHSQPRLERSNSMADKTGLVNLDSRLALTARSPPAA
jgi:hypothetical protein